MKRLVLISVFVLSPFCVEAQQADAEDAWSGHITLGADGLDLDHQSSKYGEYTGITDDGVYARGDLSLRYDRDAHYMELRGENLGREYRHVALEGGKAGRYRVIVDYNELIKLTPNPSVTPLDGAGTASLTLPPGFVTGDTTSQLITLSSSLKDVELKQRRRIGGAGFATGFGPMAVDMFYSREYKDGLRSIGGPVGANPGSARSIVMPELVDYITDKLNAALAFNGKRAQIQLDYTLSLFSNLDESFRWQTPFDVTAGTYQSPIPSTGLDARTSLPPSNQYHRFAVSGGINLPYATRLSGAAEYGIMKQDEDLLPFSTSTDTSLLPRSSADAEINTRGLTIALAARPAQRLGLTASYKYYGTDNKMPRELFQYVILDNVNGTQNAAAAANALYSLPYDWVQNLMKVEASYYLFSVTSLLIGYDRDVVARDYREVDKTRENTYRARLASGYFSGAQASVDYSLGVRNSVDDYSGFKQYTDEHTSAHVATVAPNAQFDNAPEFRKFDVADKNRTKVGATLTTFPHHTATVGFYYNFLQDDYNHSTLGLQNQTTASYTVDATMTPLEILSTRAYYTRESIEADQASRSFGGGATKAAQAADPTRDWEADHDNVIDTVGAGSSLSLMDDRLTITADYSYSAADTAITLRAGSALTPPPGELPKLRTKLNSLSLLSKYRYTPNFTIGVGYEYEAYESDDWSTDGVDPGSTAIAQVLTLSGSVPDYTAHLVTLFVTVNF